MSNQNKDQLILFVRIKSSLSRDEMYAIAKERESQFKAIAGIRQKYYVQLAPNEFGGVYIWDSKESLQEYRESELASTIAKAYKAIEPPEITMMDIMFKLRD